MQEIRCNFCNNTVRNDLGCQLCWMKKMNDPKCKDRAECMGIHFKSVDYSKKKKKKTA